MNILQYIAQIPAFTFHDLTLLSIVLALVGASYLAFEFFDRPQQGILRWFVQVTIPLLSAFAISIPFAVVLWLLSLIPVVNNTYTGVFTGIITYDNEGAAFITLSQFSYLVLIIGAFIGLFHGVFAEWPQATMYRSVIYGRRQRKWSSRGRWQGAIFGFLLGFCFSYGLELVFRLVSNTFSVGNFSQLDTDYTNAGTFGIVSLVLGFIWRGRLYRPEEETERSLRWDIFLVPYKKIKALHHALFVEIINLVDDSDDEEESGKRLAAQQLAAYRASQNFTRFSHDEARTAGRFWFVVSLVVAVELIILPAFLIHSFSFQALVVYIISTMFTLLFLAVTGWFAGGLSSFARWISHGNNSDREKKRFGYIGATLTVIAFLLQLAEPLAPLFQPLSGLPGPASIITWSPDGTMLAVTGNVPSNGRDTTLRIQIINPETGATIQTIEPANLNNINGLRWSTDSEQLASWDSEGNVQYWAIGNVFKNGNILVPANGSAISPVSTISWSPLNDLLAIVRQSNGPLALLPGVESGMVEVWNIKSGKQLFAFDAHAHCTGDKNSSVLTLAWSADERYLATALSNGAVCVWDASHGAFISSEQVSFLGTITKLAWTRTSESQGTNSYEVIQSAYVMNDNSYLTAYQYTPPRDANCGLLSLQPIVISADGRFVAIACQNLVEIWDTVANSRLLTYRGNFADVTGIAWSPDETLIASGSADGVVQVWDAQTGNLFTKYSMLDSHLQYAVRQGAMG